MLTPSIAKPNPHLGVSPQIPAPSPATYFDSVRTGDNPPAPKPGAASPNNDVPHGTPESSVQRTSLEGLLNAKQITLARVEAKFNEKILMSHQRLLDEQRRAILEDKNRDANLNYEDHPLMLDVKMLKEDIEEQRFSFQVDLAFEKDKVKRLEEDLKEEKGRNGAASSSVLHLEVVKKLKDELQAERDLRMEQLKSLEMLHFVELREIEKKHTDRLSRLVASHQNEIKVLNKIKVLKNADQKDSTQQECAEFWGSAKSHVKFASRLVASNQNEIKVQKIESKMDHRFKDDGKVSTRQNCESSEAVAAAALSSLSAPPVLNKLSNPTNATEDEYSSVTVSIQTPPMPPTSKDWDQGLKERMEMGRKKMSSTYEICTSKDNSILERKEVESFKRAISDVSDSDSGSESSKRPKTGQEEEVEEILLNAGITPPVKKDMPVNKKNGIKKKNMLADNVKEYLKEWMMHPDHCEHPYPTPAEKATIMADTGMSFTELNNWFVNNRKRFWKNEVKPKIEEIKNAHRLREMKWSYEALNTKSSSVMQGGCYAIG